jgi:hypothetical protein
MCTSRDPPQRRYGIAGATHFGGLPQKSRQVKKSMIVHGRKLTSQSATITAASEREFYNRDVKVCLSLVGCQHSTLINAREAPDLQPHPPLFFTDR